jgi:hypothetical protein
MNGPLTSGLAAVRDRVAVPVAGGTSVSSVTKYVLVVSISRSASTPERSKSN